MPLKFIDNSVESNINLYSTVNKYTLISFVLTVVRLKYIKVLYFSCLSDYEY